MNQNNQTNKVNLRDESKKKDYELDYGANQKARAIKRINEYLEILEELPTGAYEYGWYNLNNAIENLGNKVHKS